LGFKNLDEVKNEFKENTRLLDILNKLFEEVDEEFEKTLLSIFS